MNIDPYFCEEMMARGECNADCTMCQMIYEMDLIDDDCDYDEEYYDGEEYYDDYGDEEYDI